MAFQPRYEAIFESLALDNILAIVKRDMKLALDYYYLSENLPDFAQKTIGEFRMPDTMPCLLIDPISGGGDDGEQYESSTFKIYLYLWVEHADRVEVTRLLEKYIRALKGALKTAADIADYQAGVPANQVLPFNKIWDWKYGVCGKKTQTDIKWMRTAQFTLTLKFNTR